MKNPRFNWLILIHLFRWILGGVFLFSGLVKCIDPMGTSLKLTEYFQVFGWSWLLGWTMGLSVLMSLIEFWIGLNLVLWRNIKTTLILCGVFLGIFTPLTLYLAIANPISDCGCFGSAVVLSNWETFGKNVFLLICYFIIVWKRSSLISPFAKRLSSVSYTLYSYYSLFLCALICWVGIYRLPILDFRPFKSGININEAMGNILDVDVPSEEYRVVYEKDGIRKSFPLDAIPEEDSGWIFVEQEILPLEHAESQKQTSIKDFFVVDGFGQDVTTDILTDTTFQFILLSPSLKTASEHDIDKIEATYEYALEYGYKFYALTINDTAQINYWVYRTGAEYPMLFTDATIVETIIRANPGLMLMKDGIIYWKKSLAQLDVLSLISDNLNNQTYGQIAIINVKKRISYLILLFFIPLFVLLYFGKRKTQLNNNIKKNEKENCCGQLEDEHNSSGRSCPREGA